MGRDRSVRVRVCQPPRRDKTRKLDRGHTHFFRASRVTLPRVTLIYAFRPCVRVRAKRGERANGTTIAFLISGRSTRRKRKVKVRARRLFSSMRVSERLAFCWPCPPQTNSTILITRCRTFKVSARRVAKDRSLRTFATIILRTLLRMLFQRARLRFAPGVASGRSMLNCDPPQNFRGELQQR